MKKRLVPIGTKDSLTSITSDIQSYAETNLQNRLDSFVEQYGIICEENNGIVLSNDLKAVPIINTKTIQLYPGSAISSTNMYINNPNLSTLTVSGLTEFFGSGCFVALRAKYTYYNQLPVIDGFRYTGNIGDGATNKTKDVSFDVIALSSLNNFNSDTDFLVASGTLNILTGTFSQSSFSHDLRAPLKWNDAVLPSDIIFKKNYANTVAGHVTLLSGLLSRDNTIVGGVLNVSGLVTATDGIESWGNITISSDGEFRVTDDSSTGNSDDIYTTKLAGKTYLVAGKNTAIVLDSLQPNSDGQGYIDINGVGRILTTGETPTNPQNFRIFDINPDKYTGSNSSVTFKWNYDDITISGVNTGDGQVGATIPYININGYRRDSKPAASNDNRFRTIRSGSLVNKYLYSSQTGNKYKIVSNGDANNTTGITTIVLSSGLQLLDALNSQQTGVSQNLWRIIDDADSYYLTVERYPGDLNEVSILSNDFIQYKETYVLGPDSVTNPIATVYLPTDQTYIIKLQARKYMGNGSDVYLNKDYLDFSGETAVKYYKWQEYTNNDQTYLPPATANNSINVAGVFKNTLPSIGTGSVSVIGEPFGFTLSITGWVADNKPTNTAHEYEIMYIRGGGPTDWNTITSSNEDGTYTRIVTKSRRISIPVSSPATYSYAVWPLQNGVRVGSPITGSISAGAGGVFPDDRSIITTPFDIKTYACTVAWDTGTNPPSPYIDHTTITSPAVSGIDVSYSLGNNLIGQTITSQANNIYRINSVRNNSTNTRIYLSATKLVNNGPGESLVSGLSTINTSVYGRRIYQMLDYPSDIRLLGASIRVENAQGVSSDLPGIIRVYQYRGSFEPTDADYIQVRSSDTETYQSFDGIIQGYTSGNVLTRTIVVDAYDDDLNDGDGTGQKNNHANIKGYLTIYARPFLTDTTTARPVPFQT